MYCIHSYQISPTFQQGTLWLCPFVPEIQKLNILASPRNYGLRSSSFTNLPTNRKPANQPNNQFRFKSFPTFSRRQSLQFELLHVAFLHLTLSWKSIENNFTLSWKSIRNNLNLSWNSIKYNLSLKAKKRKKNWLLCSFLKVITDHRRTSKPSKSDLRSQDFTVEKHWSMRTHWRQSKLTVAIANKRKWKWFGIKR